MNAGRPTNTYRRAGGLSTRETPEPTELEGKRGLGNETVSQKGATCHELPGLFAHSYEVEDEEWSF